MPSLPRRPREHVLETASEKFVANIIPDEWIASRPEKDYGLDLHVELVTGEDVTGAFWSIQLKSTDHIKISKGYVKQRFDQSVLNYFMQRAEPVVCIIYDAIDKIAYWIWIKDYIQNDIKDTWKNQSTSTVKIPVTNVFNEDAIDIIRDRVIRENIKKKGLNAVINQNHPHFRYEYVSDGSGISQYPVYYREGMEGKVDVGMRGTFHFDDSPEGMQEYQKLMDFFDRGGNVSFTSETFSGFSIPEAFTYIIPDQDIPDISELHFSSVPRESILFLRIEFFDQENNTLFSIPFIELDEIQRGTDEITFNNLRQNDDFNIILIVNRNPSKSDLLINIEYREGDSIVNIYNKIEKMNKIKRCYRIVATDLKSGSNFFDTASNGFMVDSEEINELNELFEKLNFIQNKISGQIIWKGISQRKEIIDIDKIFNIVSNGVITEYGIVVTMKQTREMVRSLLDQYNSSGCIPLRFARLNYPMTILDTNIDLGPCTVEIPEATIDSNDVEQLESLLGDETTTEMIQITFKSGTNGIRFLFDKWNTNREPNPAI